MSDITAKVSIQRVTDTLYAPVRYTGVGSPEAVVTSETGWLYRDTSTNHIWSKATGTGNTGWVDNSFQTGVSSTCAIPTIVGSAGQTSFLHGLGVAPNVVDIKLECTSDELNWGVGSLLNIASMIDLSGNPPFYFTTSSVGVYCRKSYNASSAVVYVCDATSGVFTAITTAKWRFRVNCAKF